MAEDQNVNNELLNPIPNSYSNMQNGPLPGSNFRYETIEDLPIPNELEALDPALDNQYVNMLNAAAPKINSYAAAPMGNINSPYPTMAGDTYDPRKQQLPPDLTTSDGISRFLNESDFEAREVTADIPVIEDPIYASQKATNFARYYEHPNFNELGFHPYSNNEEYYNANSTWFDDGRRMWDQFKSLTGTGFMSGYRNAANYISGENAWWGTGVDLESAEEYAKAFEIGSTSREGVVPFLQNTGLNFAYTTGIMGSIALEELALFGIAALQGGLNPASDAAAIVRTGYNIGRLGKAISNSFTVGKMFNASRNMVRNLKNIERQN